jgi:hypothetical protein
LVIFIVIILFGLLGLFLVSYLGREEVESDNSANAIKAYEYLEEVAE